MIKKLLTILGSLIAAAAVGFVLMVGVYALPRTRMVNNINRSLKLLETEGNYRYWAADITNTQSDNFSDSLMADIAINPNTGNVLYDAMINCYVGWQDTADSSTWLMRTAGGEPFYEGYEQVVYGRYWHGYLLWMKPLLLFFSIPEIRLINMALQLILTAWLMILLYRETGIGGCAAVGSGLLILNPITCMMTFHFSDIYYNVLITCIVMLRHRVQLEKRDDYWKVFLWCGIGVAYFDLMTYPLVALGIPLVLFFLLNRYSLKESLGRLAANSTVWVIGYAGMWVIKWLIGSAITGYDLIGDGLGAVGLRSAGAVENISMDYLYVLMNNVQAAFTKPVIAGLAALIVVLIYRIIKGSVKLHVQSSGVAMMVMIMAYPLVWYYVIRNHSIVHVWFAYRELSIAVCAFVALLSFLVKERRYGS